MFYSLSTSIAFLILNVSLFAQTNSVEEFDRMAKVIWKENKRRGIDNVKIKFKDKIFRAAFLKENNHILAVSERKRHNQSKHEDYVSLYLFGYINDTLTIVFVGKPSGAVRAYISKDEIIASRKWGECILPDVPTLKEKSRQLLTMAEEKISTLVHDR